MGLNARKKPNGVSGCYRCFGVVSISFPSLGTVVVEGVRAIGDPLGSSSVVIGSVEVSVGVGCVEDSTVGPFPIWCCFDTVVVVSDTAVCFVTAFRKENGRRNRKSSFLCAEAKKTTYIMRCMIAVCTGYFVFFALLLKSHS